MHLASALVYPVFPMLGAWVAGLGGAVPGVIKVWSAGLVTALLLRAVLALAGVAGHELRWMGRVEIERLSVIWRLIMSRGSNSLPLPSLERVTLIFRHLRD